MSDVLIKNMKLPERCGRCFAANAFDCAITGNYIKDHMVRQDWCPLVEIPPHGRLIDADYIEAIDMKPWDAPTIIPANDKM